MVDLLEYLRGDGRLYELVNTWGSSEITQTQTEANNVFFHVKNSQWEELWADEVYIYRGTDCSPGNAELYMLSESNHYGSAWVPRWFEIGQTFKRNATVIWRRKSDGSAVASKPPGVQVSYLRLERIYSQLTFQSGIQLQDVAELHAYVDDGGKPASSPWEKYFYARGFGLVGFEDMYGTFKSWIAQKFTQQIMPNRVREVIPWLPPLQKRYYLPAVPAVTQAGQFTLTKVPQDWINLRTYPNNYGKDIGDLRVNDVVMLYTPEMNGWVHVQKGDLRGWVSRQNGAVVFSETNNPDPEPPPGLPELTPAGEYILTQTPSNWVNVRDYPNDSANDIGDLYKNDVVTLYSPEVEGWVYVQGSGVQGWVSRQNGKVGFTVVVTPDELIPPDDLPELPEVEPVGQYILSKIPSQWINIRAYPNDKGTDIGDLQKNDVVMLYMPEVEGWLFVDNGLVHGWVSLQNGKVAFTPAPDAPPIPHDDLPALPTQTPVGKFTVSKMPTTFVNVRAYPIPSGTDIGDLHKGNVVTLHAPEVNGWVFVENANLHGWVSRQNGTVDFTAVTAAQALELEQAQEAAMFTPLAAALTASANDYEADTEEYYANGNGSDEEETSPIEKVGQRLRSGIGRIFQKKG
jgi:uncharacterized protein YgiM (DUF1202 family)